MKIILAISFLMFLLLLTSCSSTNDDDDAGDAVGDDDTLDDDDDDDDDSADDDATTQIVWLPCSLTEDANDGLAECGTAQLPLRYDDPDGPTIEVASKRWLADGDGAGQIWLLQGGPGASGMMTFDFLMKELREVLPEYDLYTIDHRGVGYSSPLNCPEQEAEDSDEGVYLTYAEFDACIAWLNDNLGDDLKAYSTRNAANDLAAFIDATREDGKSVFVWGGSYGTYLTERYLLLHPDQADGAIIDSIHAVSVPGIEFSHWRNQNGKALLQRCAEDAYCSDSLGPDPWARLQQLYNDLESGHCSILGVDHYTLAYLLGWLAWYSPLDGAVPALIYRIERCDYADVDAVVYMWDNVFNGSGDLLGITGNWWSQVLNANISLSDQYWGPAFDGVDVEQYFDDLMQEVLIGDIGTMDQYELYEKWPKYDELQARVLPQTDIPVLMLQGALDGSTPLAQAQKITESLNGTNQYWLVFPESAHGVGSDSFLADDPDAPTCGDSVLAQFVRNPAVAPDDTCLAQTLPVDFEGTEVLADYLFGTDHLWDNPPESRSRSSVNRDTPDFSLLRRIPLRR